MFGPHLLLQTVVHPDRQSNASRTLDAGCGEVRPLVRARRARARAFGPGGGFALASARSLAVRCRLAPRAGEAGAGLGGRVLIRPASAQREKRNLAHCPSKGRVTAMPPGLSTPEPMTRLRP